MRHGGGRIRTAVERATQDWVRRGALVSEVVDCIANVYDDGYGELATALHAAGWRDDGVGVLSTLSLTPYTSLAGNPAVAGPRAAIPVWPSRPCTKRWPPILAHGAAFRRRHQRINEPEASQSRQQRRWWARTLVTVLDIDQTRDTRVKLMLFTISSMASNYLTTQRTMQCDPASASETDAYHLPALTRPIGHSATVGICRNRIRRVTSKSLRIR